MCAECCLVFFEKSKIILKKLCNTQRNYVLLDRVRNKVSVLIQLFISALLVFEPNTFLYHIQEQSFKEIA